MIITVALDMAGLTDSTIRLLVISLRRLSMGDPLLGMADLPLAGMGVEKMLELESCRMWTGFDSSEIPGGFDKSGFVFLFSFCYLRLVLDMTHGSGVWRITALYFRWTYALFSFFLMFLWCC
jgi:hypothetical protein